MSSHLFSRVRRTDGHVYECRLSHGVCNYRGGMLLLLLHLQGKLNESMRGCFLASIELVRMSFKEKTALLVCQLGSSSFL